MDIDHYYDGDWRTQLSGAKRPVSLDDYEGPEGGNDDEPVDPRDEDDYEPGSYGIEDRNWSY